MLDARIQSQSFVLLVLAGSVLISAASGAGTGCEDALDPSPFITPSFADFAAVDDSAVFEAVLDAAGYSPDSGPPPGNKLNEWVGVAAGNFCGGVEQELALVQNREPFFSILRAPTPFHREDSNANSDADHPWRAVTSGNFDVDAYDEIVAVREVTAPGIPDVVILDADASCELSVLSTQSIGTVGNSEWADVAVGNFDGVSGSEIAMVKNTAAYFVFSRFFDDGVSQSWDVYLTANLGTRAQYPWASLAAGDIDGAAGDELIVARTVVDGDGDTIRAYEWDTGTSNFSLLATSSIANTGDHTWIQGGAAAGDFGGDDREAVVFTKDKHSNFILIDYPPDSGAVLRWLEGSDLETSVAEERDWRGAAAVDWFAADEGHEELVALRSLEITAAESQREMNVLISGNRFHRQLRESGMNDTRSVLAGNEVALACTDPGGVWTFYSAEQIRSWLGDLGANTFHVELRLRGEYEFLIEFLEATRDICIGGRKIRVWVVVPGPTLVDANEWGDYVEQCYETEPPDCTGPQSEDGTVTCRDLMAQLPVRADPTPGIDEAAYFQDPSVVGVAKDYIGWASLVSRLAQDYPQIVGFGIDDFFSSETFTPPYIAEIRSRLSWPSPWLSFVPTVYYRYFFDSTEGPIRPDYPLTFDSMLYYDENHWHESEIDTSLTELDEIALLQAASQKLQSGVYFSAPGALSDTPPTLPFVHTLTASSLARPWVSGVAAYTGYGLWGRGTSDYFCAARAGYWEQPFSEVAACVAAHEPPGCANGVDDDGDQLIDGADPGCADAADVFESDPFTLCDNGRDDDEDGLIDLQDPGCISASGVSEQGLYLLDVLGDVDCDGNLTPVDASVVLGLFVGNIVDGDLSPPCNSPSHRLAISDWDLSGSINPIDASITLSIFVGAADVCETDLGQSIPGLCPQPPGVPIQSSVASAAPSSASLRVSRGKARRGGEVTVEVRTQTALELASSGLTLAYDSGALDVVSVASPLDGFTYRVDEQAGVIRTASAGLGQSLAARDPLISVVFRVKADAGRGRHAVSVLGDLGGPVLKAQMPARITTSVGEGFVQVRGR